MSIDDKRCGQTTSLRTEIPSSRFEYERLSRIMWCHVSRFERVTLHSPDGTLLVRELSLEVRQGESLILMGPNGRSALTLTVSSIPRITSSYDCVLPYVGTAPFDRDNPRAFWNGLQLQIALGRRLSSSLLLFAAHIGFSRDIERPTDLQSITTQRKWLPTCPLCLNTPTRIDQASCHLPKESPLEDQSIFIKPLTYVNLARMLLYLHASFLSSSVLSKVTA